MCPTDPTTYRFYEMIQVYGSTLKALVHELFIDGIISAINFRLDIKKVDELEGGSRAVITSARSFADHLRCANSSLPFPIPHR